MLPRCSPSHVPMLNSGSSSMSWPTIRAGGWCRILPSPDPRLQVLPIMAARQGGHSVTSCTETFWESWWQTTGATCLGASLRGVSGPECDPSSLLRRGGRPHSDSTASFSPDKPCPGSRCGHPPDGAWGICCSFGCSGPSAVPRWRRFLQVGHGRPSSGLVLWQSSSSSWGS